MTKIEHGRGTVRCVKGRDGAVKGYRAILPRELSTPPKGCRNPDRYQEPIGPQFETQTEARTLLDAAILEITQKHTLRNGLSFRWFLSQEIQARHQKARRDYETESRANRATSTWRSIDRCFLQEADWYDWTPSAIQHDDLQRYIAWLTDEAENQFGEPLSGDFIRNVHRLIKATFERALIKPNPARDVKLPPKGRPKVRFLDLSAQRRLYGADEEQATLEDRVMVGCGMGAGLRVGELLSMEAGDVHLDDEDPHLWVQYGGPDRSPTKGRRARRVELFEPGLGFWRLWMERYYRPGERLVFVGPAGGYQKHWPDRFPSWASAAGVERLSSHIMRHTYAVALLSGTWGYEPKSLEFVSQQLGHAELQTTQRYYGAFEAGTWKNEVRRMTGRLVAVRARDAVTAAKLLGLDAQVDALKVTSQPKMASGWPSGVDPRWSPNLAKTPEETGSIDAQTHQSFGELAARVLALAGAGDGRTFAVARELAERVLSRQDVVLATQVLAGGPHAVGRAIHLASLLVNGPEASSPVVEGSG